MSWDSRMLPATIISLATGRTSSCSSAAVDPRGSAGTATTSAPFGNPEMGYCGLSNNTTGTTVNGAVGQVKMSSIPKGTSAFSMAIV